ncbi:MAG: cytosine methyltransferase [Ponticaulis sp.]|nr:cytosine methyltransferase [Ponticaulis sp.]
MADASAISKTRFPVRRQHPIEGFVAEFAITKVRLLIEIDGGIHNHPEVIARDLGRDAVLNSLGWRVLRIPNDEAFHPEHLHERVATAIYELE